MDIVEHVARAISMRIFDRGMESCREDALAAIKATLEHLRDNVSEGMNLTGMAVGDYPWDGRKPERVFATMINQALKEIE